MRNWQPSSTGSRGPFRSSPFIFVISMMAANPLVGQWLGVRYSGVVGVLYHILLATASVGDLQHRYCLGIRTPDGDEYEESYDDPGNVAEALMATDHSIPKSPNSRRCLRSCDSCKMALCMDDHGHQDEFHFCMSCLINGAADHHGKQDGPPPLHADAETDDDGVQDVSGTGESGCLAEVGSTKHGGATRAICQHCGHPGGHSHLLALMSAPCGRRIHRICYMDKARLHKALRLAKEEKATEPKGQKGRKNKKEDE
jgi:hypothetical protein